MKSCVYVVGIGAGNQGGMTLDALNVLKDVDLIVGYTVYCDLIQPFFPEKDYFSTPMTKERERCRKAFEEAQAGRKVAVVCSGDPGVYGLASLLLEMAGEEETAGDGKVEIRVIPGVTAALSGAALLGAPLSGDFAVISMSDLMTPMELIKGRLRAAAGADMPIVLYNPSSRKRAGYLKIACDIVLEVRNADTVCGAARNIGREGECVEIMTLGELRDYRADMFTTVFIGNSETKAVGGRMITPRGYRE